MIEFATESKLLPKAADFYSGKSIFLTGATGFLGTVLLETLLRCCPGIKYIYILVREKKNVGPETRKEEILNKRIFDVLKQKNTRVLQKVYVISGDVSLPNLGMREEDAQLLIKEVSIVFHCAAIIHLSKTLKFILLNNALSLHSIIELCKRMINFEVLVYTSTAYSNSNHAKFISREEVYRLPFRAEKFLDALKNEDDSKLQELFAHCKPNWPDTYTFSKCLAENVIMDTASDLPVAIIRPSTIISTCKHPMAGYEENNSVLTAFFTGAGKGVLKVIYGDPDCVLNLVPVDIVANTHIVAAWCIGIKRCAFPMIVNSTATEKFNVAISDYVKSTYNLAVKFPLPQSFTQPTYCITVSYKYLFFILATYYHYLPAVIFDLILKILGKKPWLYALSRFLDKAMFSSAFFRFHTFQFDRNNLDKLDKLIHSEERKNLSLDFKDISFEEVSLKIPGVSPYYDWKTDKKSPSERQRTKTCLSLVTTCIQWTFLTILSLLLYWIFCLIFICH